MIYSNLHDTDGGHPAKSAFLFTRASSATSALFRNTIGVGPICIVQNYGIKDIKLHQLFRLVVNLLRMTLLPLDQFV
jgi:hypothetical protein